MDKRTTPCAVVRLITDDTGKHIAQEYAGNSTVLHLVMSLELDDTYYVITEDCGKSYASIVAEYDNMQDAILMFYDILEAIDPTRA